MGRTAIKLSCYGVLVLLAGVILFGCGKPVPVNAQQARATPTATPTPQATPGTGSNLCVPHPTDGKAPPLVSLDAIVSILNMMSASMDITFNPAKM